MKFGFVSIYAWRPHVEQMHYLARLLTQAGHEVSFLSCDSDLPSCNIRQLRPHRSGALECLKCRAGGTRSYVKENTDSLGDLAPCGVPFQGDAFALVRSSASTLGRFESDADFASPAFAAFAAALQPIPSIVYPATRAWIEKEKLDGLFLFNGRMDATRAILEAAKDAGIPFASMERTWFGDGIQLLPQEDCLGLSTGHRMVAEWSEVPLSRLQALTAARYLALRFLRRNHNEWRAYNVNAQNARWPVENAAHRFLLLPGSRSEIWGHPDWRDNWAERTAAYDALIDHFKLKPSDLVLRCHPHWGEKIGRTDGKMPEDYYTNWARKRGVLCIASTATASTMSLIEQSDAAVVSGSAALEAGALGKQVMALAPCWYQNAGFQTTLYGAEDLAGQTLDKDRTPEERAILARERQKHTLRFLYTIAHRFAQFVPYVRCESTTHYSYFEGADPDRLIRLMRTGVLEPDDAFRAPDDREENEILDLIAARAWEKLINPPPKPSLSVLAINRRFPYQALDWLRAKLRRGDL